jgi:SAM-dependent methyltransferase
MRALTVRGCAVVGVDGSAPLVAAATGSGEVLRLSYAELTAEPARVGQGFDLVVANFALLDEQIAPLLAALCRIMTAGGWLLVQTLHPLSAGPPYRDGWRTEDFRGFGEAPWTPMPWYFRTLGSWLEVLRDGGFAHQGLREPVDAQDQRPLSLLLEARVARDGTD